MEVRRPRPRTSPVCKLLNPTSEHLIVELVLAGPDIAGNDAIVVEMDAHIGDVLLLRLIVFQGFRFWEGWSLAHLFGACGLTILRTRHLAKEAGEIQTLKSAIAIATGRLCCQEVPLVKNA